LKALNAVNTSNTVSCPVCSNNAAYYKVSMPIDAKTFKPTPHGKVFECADCNFSFIYPRPTPEDTKHFYDLDSYYTQGKSHFVETGAPSFIAKVRTHLAWRADKGETLIDIIRAYVKPDSTILDIGCGAGTLLQKLSTHGYKTIGVERDARSLSLEGMGIKVLEGSVESLPAEILPSSCDGIVISHVLEHLSDPIFALQNAAKLLKPDGLLFCEVPNNESLISMQSGLSWEHLDIPRHINFFNERSLKVIAQNAGFKINRIYFGGYCRIFDDSYIATEQRIHDQLIKHAGLAVWSKRNSALRSWGLLVKSAFAKRNKKYDYIGVICSL
jgi:2-polyprenyl-3-methyl-5-hydroxy-6-metoxy-1,4-benzoquinol methylase